MNSPKTLYHSPFYKLSTFRNKFQYVPHKQQLSFHLSGKRFNTVAAGARAGKSMGGGAEGAYSLLFPDKHIWYCSSIYELANKEFEWTLEFLSRFQTPAGKKLIEYAKVSNPQRGQKRIEFPWGSWGETKSTAKLENLLGEEIDLLVVGEASQVPKIAWERYLRARLGPRKGVSYFLSTPNWDAGLFKELYDCGISDDPAFKDYASFQFSVLANPTFDRDEYELAKSTMDATVFAEQYDGKFVTRRGLVFPMFSESHIYTEIPKYFEQWPVYVTWHHERNAYNNPLVALCIAVCPDDMSLWVFDEFYKTQSSVSEATQYIKKAIHGRRLISNITDFSNSVLQESLEQLWPTVFVNDEKRYTKRHSLVRRIQALQTALKVRDDGSTDIHINKACENFRNDMRSCKWPERKKEELEQAEVELPTTKYVSSPAALSYVVAFAEIAQGNNIYEAQMARSRAA